MTLAVRKINFGFLGKDSRGVFIAWWARDKEQVANCEMMMSSEGNEVKSGRLGCSYVEAMHGSR